MSPTGDLERDRPDDGGQPVGEFSAADADVGGGLDDVLPPPDEPQGLDEYGVTAEEQREGEPLDVRLDREEPEGEGGLIEEQDAVPAAGRLVEPGSEAVDSVDTTPESIAREAGIDPDALSAEEAAVRIEE